MNATPDTSWMERIPLMQGAWDAPGWSCCGVPECQFVEKCRGTERMDAAYLQWRAEREAAAGEH